METNTRLIFTMSVQSRIWFSTIFLKTSTFCSTGDAHLLILVFLQETKPEQGMSESGLTEESSQMSRANRYPQNHSTEMHFCTWNKQEWSFKNESKLPQLFEQRNTVSVKYFKFVTHCTTEVQIGGPYPWQGYRPCGSFWHFCGLAGSSGTHIPAPWKHNLIGVVLQSYMYFSRVFKGIS